ncbi:MAG TPA: histidine phosphatase family protein [Egibacteraceae bacterium]|nr:histidine phosphatase family protein [Egibacteraceae bacterium]
MRRVRLVLVRHAESLWNAAGIFQGHEGPGLTERGHAQARATAKALGNAYADATLIARSDLIRVVETAAPTERQLALPVHVDQRLRELDVGSWAGKTHAQIRADDPAAAAAWGRGVDVTRGGGESFADLRRRAWAALCEVAERAGEGSALVFTHGGPIRVGVAAALSVPPGREQSLGSVANCSLTVLERHDRDMVLVAYNRVGHLSATGLE